jgi:Protein of unknown function (DUF2905)
MPGLSETGRVLVVAGIVLVALGVALSFAGRVPGLGRLPGDFVFRRGGVTFYLPLATCLLLSALLTLFLALLRR